MLLVQFAQSLSVFGFSFFKVFTIGFIFLGRVINALFVLLTVHIINLLELIALFLLELLKVGDVTGIAGLLLTSRLLEALTVLLLHFSH